MNIQIIGDGSFGQFLKKELPKVGFKLTKWGDRVDATILAIPASQYASYINHISDDGINDELFVNVCSIQEATTDVILRRIKKVVSIHPLFGARTPEDKRYSILTHLFPCEESKEFLGLFSQFSQIEIADENGVAFTPESHDRLMAKTHLRALEVAKIAKILIQSGDDIPDYLIPNSYRLLRNFVKTLDDMPQGTVESILANPYA